MSSDNDPSGGDSLGRAANRYVTFQIVSAVIGGIVFLILLFAVFLPMFNRVSNGNAGQSGPVPSSEPGTTTLTINGRPATPAERKSFEQHMNNPQSPLPGPPR